MQDVAWHNHNEHIFGSVGDDKQLIIWDTRKQSALRMLPHACGPLPAAGIGLSRAVDLPAMPAAGTPDRPGQQDGASTEV